MKQILFVFLFFIPVLHAEEAERGRLPDGRAFRTGVDGTQLVDYIAELEVSVESLNRQVQGLEDENKEKQAVIDRLRGGGEFKPTLQERDLGARTHQAASRAPVQPQLPCEPKVVETVVEKIVEKPVSCPQVSCPAPADTVDCGTVVAKARQDEAQLFQNTINRQNQEIEELRGALSKASTEARLVAQQRTTSAAPLLSVRSAASPGTLSESRIRAVDSLRQTMQRDIKSLENLVSYRDQLYARVDKSRFPSVNSVPLRELKQQLERAEQVSELSRARTAMNESRGKIQQEIALFKRELKIR